MNNQLRQVTRTSDNDLGVWIRNATDKGKKKVMILFYCCCFRTSISYENCTRSS